MHYHNYRLEKGALINTPSIISEPQTINASTDSSRNLASSNESSAPIGEFHELNLQVRLFNYAIGGFKMVDPQDRTWQSNVYSPKTSAPK